MSRGLSLLTAAAATVLAVAVFGGFYALGRAGEEKSPAFSGKAASRLPANLRPSPVKPLGAATPLPRLARKRKRAPDPQRRRRPGREQP